MSSRIVLLLSTTRLVVALPACGPPIRKKTSCSAPGSAAVGCGLPRPWSPSAAALSLPNWRRAGDVVGPASKISPATSTPLTSATRIGTTPFSAVSVAIPSPSTTVSGRFTLIVLSTSYTPGVKIRFLPLDSALLIDWMLSVGLAMKKSSIGIEWPGVGPFAHVVPRESTRAAGTKTLKWPLAPTERYGRSRDAGFMSSVVYGFGGGGKFWDGAFTTPAKTWFQTPFVQPSMSLSRTRYCCCEPFTIVLFENCESAMKPPLEKPGPEQKSKSVVNPFTWTRRTGEACEVAQNSAAALQPVLPAVLTLIVRFASERQKFTRAVQPPASHWLYESTVPFSVTSPGEAPSPATSV